jgi:F-type H+-transporting ATPase subunit delta
VDVPGGIVAGLEGRYATALFDLARESRQIEIVGDSLNRLKGAMSESADLRTLTSSPLIGRDDAVRGARAAADALGLDPVTRNFLGVLARNRRLSALARIIGAYRKLAAAHRGEVTADVTSAHPLTEEQMQALKAKLGAGIGREVAVDLHVDSSILGGLIVRIGSRMIDSSLRTKLENVGQAMKG